MELFAMPLPAIAMHDPPARLQSSRDDSNDFAADTGTPNVADGQCVVLGRR